METALTTSEKPLPHIAVRVGLLRMLRDGRFDPKTPEEQAACVLHDFWRARGWSCPSLPDEPPSQARLVQEGKAGIGWASPEGIEAIQHYYLGELRQNPEKTRTITLSHLENRYENDLVVKVSQAVGWDLFRIPFPPTQSICSTLVPGVEGYVWDRSVYVRAPTVCLYRWPDGKRVTGTGEPSHFWRFDSLSPPFFVQSRQTGGWFSVQKGVFRWCLPETLEALPMAIRGDPAWYFPPAQH